MSQEPQPDQLMLGSDLTVELVLTSQEALLGTRKDVTLMRVMKYGAAPTAVTLQVTIPPGVNDGKRLRLAAKGHAGKDGGNPGDAFVCLHVQPSENLARRNVSGLRSASKIQNAQDLLISFDRCPDAGGQIRDFFHLAEQKPEVAIFAIAEIIETHTKVETRALAIRSLGRISHKPTKQDLAKCLSDTSQDILKMLLASLKGKGDANRDLIRWAASEAIEQIGYASSYLYHKDLEGLEEEPELIIQDVIERNIKALNRVERLNNQGKRTSEYKRLLQFWIYGATTELFKENSASADYRAIVEDVLVELQALGVMLGLGLEDETNGVAQDAAMCLARQIYKESSENEQDLYDCLESYLNQSNHDVSLRIMAAQIINSTGAWKPAEKRLSALVRCLLDEDELRIAVTHLLNLQKQFLNQFYPNASVLLEGLTFQYKLSKPTIGDMTIAQIDAYTSSAREYQNSVRAIFDQAVTASKTLASQYELSASSTVQFLNNQKASYISDITLWLENLTQQRASLIEQQNRIQLNQKLLAEVMDSARKIGLNLLNTTQLLVSFKKDDGNDCETFIKCLQVGKNLESCKESLLTEIRAETHSLSREYNDGSNFAKVCVGIGVGICLVVLLSLPLSNFFKQSNPGTFGVQSYTTTYPTSNVVAPSSSLSEWYTSGFPKANGCGSNSSPNNCWYPALIQYSDSNWDGVLSNHCGDIREGQTRETARKKGQIQVASFSDPDEARGFSNYMKSQYGSGWVGEKKCY